MALPISKLHGVPINVRWALKVAKITTSNNLLAAAGDPDDRDLLARRTRLDPDLLLNLVRRADLARINGLGISFGRMLEIVGVVDVDDLANQEPRSLHQRLRQYNAAERLTRRSPTLDEVESWVAQARSLPKLLRYPHPPAKPQTR